jgi:hypothetical protein
MAMWAGHVAVAYMHNMRHHNFVMASSTVYSVLFGFQDLWMLEPDQL